MHQSTILEIEEVANDSLQETAGLHADLEHVLGQEGMHDLSTAQLEQWRAIVMRTNKALSRLARLAWMADDRRNIEMNILLENVKRDTLDREATFAQTWTKLRQQTATLGEDGSNLSIDRAQTAAFQVESALAALAPVPNTHYHGAPALALLK